VLLPTIRNLWSIASSISEEKTRSRKLPRAMLPSVANGIVNSPPICARELWR
jgi:hypothetical protein